MMHGQKNIKLLKLKIALVTLQSLNLPRTLHSTYSCAKPIRCLFQAVFRIREATGSSQLKVSSTLNGPSPFQMALHLAVT